MLFFFTFLVLTFEKRFQKTSRALKGLFLMHVLYMCYVFCIGSGASLNPAFAFAEIIYCVILAHVYDRLYDATLIWVYIVFPFVGAVVAAKFYEIYEPISAQFINESEVEEVEGPKERLIKKQSEELVRKVSDEELKEE